jgi:hypothetical protein
VKETEEQTNKTQRKEISRKEGRIGGIKKVETRKNCRKEQNDRTCLAYVKHRSLYVRHKVEGQR